jgi:hypothetical protein
MRMASMRRRRSTLSQLVSIASTPIGIRRTPTAISERSGLGTV